MRDDQANMRTSAIGLDRIKSSVCKEQAEGPLFRNMNLRAEIN